MMQTEVWIVGNISTNQQYCPQLQVVAEWLKRDEVIAFPTETVYGLGANALSTKAIKKIYQAKGRPSDNPLIVHISSVDMLDNLVREIPKTAEKLMKVFWPGPLTIIFPRKKSVPDCVAGGLDTVGVRMPDHCIARALIQEAGVPIAAPSANLSGKPSPTTVKHVIEDLNGRIPIIVDGGNTEVGVESTVIDCSVDIPVILRPGQITKEAIEAVLNMSVDCSEDEEPSSQTKPKAPGMKYRHYAPKSPVKLVDNQLDVLQQEIQKQKVQGKRVGILSTEEICKEIEDGTYKFSLGQAHDLSAISKKLYEGLRSFDDEQVDIILATIVEEKGIGKAIMNRLRKASEG